MEAIKNDPIWVEFTLPRSGQSARMRRRMRVKELMILERGKHNIVDSEGKNVLDDKGNPTIGINLEALNKAILSMTTFGGKEISYEAFEELDIDDYQALNDKYEETQEDESKKKAEGKDEKKEGTISPNSEASN